MNAQKKRRQRLAKVYTSQIREDIQSLIERNNAFTLPERQVTVEAAVEVANRDLRKTRDQHPDSRAFSALRAVSAHIALVTNNKYTSSSLQNSDLLPVGHPLSTREHAMTASALAHAQARWIAADKFVADESRALVASAFSLEPGSVERRHAFARLSAMPRTSVPRMLALDPIIAAFGLGLGGDSKAARSMRAKLQRRDRYGRFAFMGGGFSFNLRGLDGTFNVTSGRVVGATGTEGVELEIKGDDVLPDGIYTIPASKGQSVKAIISPDALKKSTGRTPGAKSTGASDLFVDQATLERRDAPSGWEAVDTAQGAPQMWKTTDGYFATKDGEDYSLHRADLATNEIGEKVASGNSWADIQEATVADQDDYAKVLEADAAKTTAPEAAKELAQGGAPADWTTKESMTVGNKVTGWNHVSPDGQYSVTETATGPDGADSKYQVWRRREGGGNDGTAKGDAPSSDLTSWDQVEASMEADRPVRAAEPGQKAAKEEEFRKKVEETNKPSTAKPVELDYTKDLATQLRQIAKDKGRVKIKYNDKDRVVEPKDVFVNKYNGNLTLLTRGKDNKDISYLVNKIERPYVAPVELTPEQKRAGVISSLKEDIRLSYVPDPNEKYADFRQGRPVGSKPVDTVKANIAKANLTEAEKQNIINWGITRGETEPADDSRRPFYESFFEEAVSVPEPTAPEITTEASPDVNTGRVRTFDLYNVSDGETDEEIQNLIDRVESSVPGAKAEVHFSPERDGEKRVKVTVKDENDNLKKLASLEGADGYVPEVLEYEMVQPPSSPDVAKEIDYVRKAIRQYDQGNFNEKDIADVAKSAVRKGAISQADADKIDSILASRKLGGGAGETRRIVAELGDVLDQSEAPEVTPEVTPEFISPDAAREVLDDGLSTVNSALGDIPDEDLDNLDEEDSDAITKAGDLLDSAQDAIDKIDPVGSDTNDLHFEQARADLGEAAQILSEANNGDMQNAGFDLKEAVDNFIALPQIDFGGGRAERAAREVPAAPEAPTGPEEPDMEMVLDEEFNATFETPEGAYKPRIFEYYTPEGRTDQDSADYTDDPAILANQFDRPELAIALREAVLPSDENDATGFGSLEFEAGQETVPAEALYEALRSQGVDADEVLAAIYDSQLDPDREQTNLERISMFKEDERILGGDAEIPTITDRDKDVVKAVEKNRVIGKPSKSQRAVDLMSDFTETNPKIKDLADDLMKRQDEGLGYDSFNLSETLQQYIPWSTSADPKEREAFMGLWGVLMSLDGGSSNEKLTPESLSDPEAFRTIVYDALLELSNGDTDIAEDAYYELVDNFGGMPEFVAGKEAIANGNDDLGTESVAASFYRLVAASSRPNEKSIYRSIGVRDDDELLKKYTTEGSLFPIDARSFTSTNITDGSLASQLFYPAGAGESRVIFAVAPGNTDSIDASTISWFAGENEHFAYGDFEVVGVRQQPGLGGKKPEYIVEIRKTTKALEAEEPTVPGTSYSDIEGWTRVSKQLGSNPGGIFEDEGGNKYYVKIPKSPSHAQNESLASALYREAGVPAVEVDLGFSDGELRTVSPIVPDSSTDLAFKLDDAEYISKLQEGFAIDAWLANWDVAGLEYDNVITDANGNPIRVDPGGALMWRAQGAPKGSLFGNKVNEIDTLRDEDLNPSSSEVFSSMTDDDIRNSAAKLIGITPDRISEIVDSIITDQEEATTLKNRLIARRDDILKRFGPKEEDLLNEDQLLDIEEDANAPKPPASPDDVVAMEEYKNALADYQAKNVVSKVWDCPGGINAAGNDDPCSVPSADDLIDDISSKMDAVGTTDNTATAEAILDDVMLFIENAQDEKLKDSTKEKARKISEELAEIREGIKDGTITNDQAIARLNAISDSIPVGGTSDDALTLEAIAESIDDYRRILDGSFEDRPFSENLPPSGKGYAKDKTTFVSIGKRVRNKWGYAGTVDRYDKNSWQVWVTMDIDPGGVFAPGYKKMSFSTKTLDVIEEGGDDTPWIDVPGTPEGKKPKSLDYTPTKFPPKGSPGEAYSKEMAKKIKKGSSPSPKAEAPKGATETPEALSDEIGTGTPKSEVPSTISKAEKATGAYAKEHPGSKIYTDSRGGQLWFSTKKGQLGERRVFIHAVLVDENSRRQGIGADLLDKLANDYFGSQISPGGLTEDGEPFWNWWSNSRGLAELSDPQFPNSRYLMTDEQLAARSAGKDVDGSNFPYDVISNTTPETELGNEIATPSEEQNTLANRAPSDEILAKLITAGSTDKDVNFNETWADHVGQYEKTGLPHEVLRRYSDYLASRDGKKIDMSDKKTVDDLLERKLIQVLDPDNDPNNQKYWSGGFGTLAWGIHAFTSGVYATDGTDAGIDRIIERMNSEELAPYARGGGYYDSPAQFTNAPDNKVVGDFWRDFAAILEDPSTIEDPSNRLMLSPAGTLLRALRSADNLEGNYNRVLSFKQDINDPLHPLNYLLSGEHDLTLRPSSWSRRDSKEDLKTTGYDEGVFPYGNFGKNKDSLGDVLFTVENPQGLDARGLPNNYGEQEVILTNGRYKVAKIEKKEVDGHPYTHITLEDQTSSGAATEAPEKSNLDKAIEIDSKKKLQKKIATHKELLDSYKDSELLKDKELNSAVRTYVSNSSGINITALLLTDPDPVKRQEFVDRSLSYPAWQAGMTSEEELIETVQNIEKMTEAIESAPRLKEDGVVLYRSIKGAVGEMVIGLKEGDEFINKGFSSTSIDVKTSGFILDYMDTDAAMLVMTAGPETKAVYVDAVTGEKKMNEFEVLLQRGTKFKVLRKSTTQGPYGKIPLIYVEIVDQEPEKIDIDETLQKAKTPAEVTAPENAPQLVDTSKADNELYTPSPFQDFLDYVEENNVDAAEDEGMDVLEEGSKDWYSALYDWVYKVTKSPSEKFKDAWIDIETYAGKYYSSINNALRNEEKTPSKNYPLMQGRLMETKLPEGLTLYRGVSKWEGSEDLEEGSIVTDRAFQSFAIEPRHLDKKGIGSDYAIELVTTLGPNARGAVLSQSTEKEVLLPAGVKYRIDEITKNEQGKTSWKITILEQGEDIDFSDETTIDEVPASSEALAVPTEPEGSVVVDVAESDVDAAEIKPEWQVMPVAIDVDKLESDFDKYYKKSNFTIDPLVNEDVTDAERLAAAGLINYQSEGYSDINGLLRGQSDDPMTPEERRAAAARVASLDNLFDTAPVLPEDSVLYRGIHSEYSDELMRSHDVGDLFVDKSYASATLSKDVAEEWAASHDADFTPKVEGATPPRLVLEIVTPAGTKGIYLPSYLGGALDYGSEYEVLLDRGTTFRVISKTEDAEGVTRSMRVAVVDQTREPVDAGVSEVIKAATPEPTVTLTGKVTGSGSKKITVDSPLTFDYTAYEDVPSLTAAMSSLSNKDVKYAKVRGASALFDSGDVEDLEVRLEGIVDEDGKEAMRISYKLTSWAGDALVKNTEDEGSWDSSDDITIPSTSVDPSTEAILIKDKVYPQYQGNGTTYVANLDYAKVTLRRANDVKHALHNYVTIDLPYGSSDEDIKLAMEVGGIGDVRPATSADFNVLAENRLMSIFGRHTDASKNLKLASVRAKTLAEIEEKYGIKASDVSVSVGPSGQIETRIPDSVAQKIVEKTRAKYLIHNFNMEVLARLAASEQKLDFPNLGAEERERLLIDGVIDFLVGPRGGGLMATRTRWFSGAQTGGMSSTSDINTGGADYVFMTPRDAIGYKHMTGVYSNSEGELMFDAAKLYTRLDWYANYNDEYGKRFANKDVIENAREGAYEVMFKKRVGLESLESFAIKKDLRDKLLVELDKRGVTEIHGKPVNEILVVAGQPSDPTDVGAAPYLQLTKAIADLGSYGVAYSDMRKYLNSVLGDKFVLPPSSSVVYAATPDMSTLLVKDDDSHVFWYYNSDGTRQVVYPLAVPEIAQGLGKEGSDLIVFNSPETSTKEAVSNAIAKFKSGEFTAEELAKSFALMQISAPAWSSMVEISSFLAANPAVQDIFKKIVKGGK